MSNAEQTARIDADPSAGGGGLRQAYLIRIGQSFDLDHAHPLFIGLADLKLLKMGRGEAEGMRAEDRTTYSVSLNDRWMSGRHAEVLHLKRSGDSVYMFEDLDSTNGSAVNGIAAKAPVQLRHGDIVETGRTFWKFYQRPLDDRETLLGMAYGGGDSLLRSYSFDLLQQLTQLDRIGPSMIPIILLGASGTGKEVMAGEIHRRSARKGQYVALNCAAIPEGLIESELFGHKKGAFTGAVDHKEGVVERADGGTLLLDEIGDMSLPAQAKLLRLLQEGTFTRVGESNPRRVDVRFVAATHRDLVAMVEKDSFRGDLYARLRGYTIKLPNLAERREDLGLLISRFLAAAGSLGSTMTHEAYRTTVLYDWPFNIRELKKVVDTAVTLAGKGEEIRLKHLPEQLWELEDEDPLTGEGWGATGTQKIATPDLVVNKPPRARRQFSDDELIPALKQAMVEHAGNISAVARALDTTRAQVHRWMKRYGLDPEQFRDV